MSTANRRDPRSAAKRRATTRKRIRGLGKYIFAYSIIAILVLGTVSAVFIAQVPVSTGDTGNQAVVPTATSAANDSLAVLVKNGDDAANAGRFAEAVTFYRAYLAQNPADGEVHFKAGRAYVSDLNPESNYVAGVDHLQRALNINPNASYAAEAQGLIQQWSTKASEGATATAQASSAVTATTGITGTGGISPTTPLTP
jgi:tetratricopeptide (TPR) repeat protein